MKCPYALAISCKGGLWIDGLWKEHANRALQWVKGIVPTYIGCPFRLTVCGRKVENNAHGQWEECSVEWCWCQNSTTTIMCEMNPPLFTAHPSILRGKHWVPELVDKGCSTYIWTNTLMRHESCCFKWTRGPTTLWTDKKSG